MFQETKRVRSDYMGPAYTNYGHENLGLQRMPVQQEIMYDPSPPASYSLSNQGRTVAPEVIYRPDPQPAYASYRVSPPPSYHSHESESTRGNQVVYVQYVP